MPSEFPDATCRRDLRLEIERAIALLDSALTFMSDVTAIPAKFNDEFFETFKVTSSFQEVTARRDRLKAEDRRHLPGPTALSGPEDTTEQGQRTGELA